MGAGDTQLAGLRRVSVSGSASSPLAVAEAPAMGRLGVETLTAIMVMSTASELITLMAVHGSSNAARWDCGIGRGDWPLE